MDKKIGITFQHSECIYYIAESYVGFKVVNLSKGESYSGHESTYNTLVFILDGEVEFSYNEYTERHFSKGDLMFIPHASHLYGTAIADTRMLVLSYDLLAESYCSKCILSRMKFNTHGIDEIQYDFKPLRMTKSILLFAELTAHYIIENYRCMLVHELKQQELFIIMQYSYTHKEMMEFFYPIIGENIPFRAKVMRIAHEQPTVKEYASMLHMSPRNFTRKFNTEFGETVYQWLLKRKVAQVFLKLNMPDVSVTDIIDEFKFSDTSHFYRFCKRHYGYTSKELSNLLSTSNSQ